MALHNDREALVSYPYTLNDLLRLLYDHAPTKVTAIARDTRAVRHGLLSVGLKIHCMEDASPFMGLINGLGGAKNVLEINAFRRKQAAMCWVLPPLGSTRTAIDLLEAIEEATAYPLFENENIQIQVCSPGRLSSRRAALLSAMFYLGSDTLRWITLEELATTFSKIKDGDLRRGRRITLYDAGYGQFDREFAWWGSGLFGKRVVFDALPFLNERTDVLTATTRNDVENVNLVATLLVHAQGSLLLSAGYWARLGREFEARAEDILERHGLADILSAPWIVTGDDATMDDNRYHNALQKLMARARSDAERIRMMGAEYWSLPKSQRGLLSEIQELLREFRNRLVHKAQSFEQEGDR